MQTNENLKFYIWTEEYSSPLDLIETCWPYLAQDPCLMTFQYAIY
jgi:hypothetical protein